ncbi:monocarboxylate transporter 12-B-like [Watersipora subatra]|uniref:monocarboxylate transporter 12-B-like n=1 Tax=Watersipora subatra TaxID=2589382 RepID=UPI00355AE442
MGEKGKELPIDKGWAWVIVGGAFCLYALQAGGFKCQGIILLEVIEQYEGVYTTPQLIWVFSLKFTLGCILAPCIGMLVVKTSHRTVAALGLLLDMIGYLGLAYSTTLPAMLLSYGVIAGVGEQMIYMVPLLVSGPYFQKRKALALGIIASGAGVGFMIIPYVLRLLFDNFSFRGACMLYGGFVLQFLIPVSLFRPMSYYVERQGSHNKADGSSTSSAASPIEEIPLKEAEEGYEKKNNNSYKNNDEDESAVFISSEFAVTPESKKAHYTSIGDIAGAATFLEEEEVAETTADTPKRPQKDRFMWRVIFIPKFLLVLVSATFFVFGAFIVLQFVPTLGKEAGISKETVAVAMMISGAAEIPCRILTGYVADTKILTNTSLFAIGIFAPGVMCLICGFISGLAGIALVLIGMAAFGTSVFILLPVVIEELVGRQYITSGMSIELFFSSIGFVSTSYIAGAIYERFGSWRMVYFYIAGALLLSSSIVWPYCMIRWLRERYAAKRASNESYVSNEQREANS